MITYIHFDKIKFDWLELLKQILETRKNVVWNSSIPENNDINNDKH